LSYFLEIEPLQEFNLAILNFHFEENIIISLMIACFVEKGENILVWSRSFVYSLNQSGIYLCQCSHFEIIYWNNSIFLEQIFNQYSTFLKTLILTISIFELIFNFDLFWLNYSFPYSFLIYSNTKFLSQFLSVSNLIPIIFYQFLVD